MKVKNLNGSKNQFVITDPIEGFEIFQSYNSVIVRKERGRIYLDEYYWNYSRTTAKYRNKFLGETTKETQKKIDDGKYELVNLN